MARSTFARLWFACGAVAALVAATASMSFSRAEEPEWYFCEDNWYLPPCSNRASCGDYYCSLFFTPGECVLIDDFSPSCDINVGKWCGHKFDCDSGRYIALSCGENVDSCVGSP